MSATMAKTVKDLVRNGLSSLFGKQNSGTHGSREYLHVENQEDSDEDGTVYPSEEMQRKSDGKAEDQQTEKKSEKTSALQAAWNVLNLIQGEK